MRNVFVVVLDERNHEVLKATPSGRTRRFHQLLDIDELQSGEIDVEDKLAQARALLDSFDGSIDAIVGYRDFPVALPVSLLCTERGLTSAALEAVLKCEHKFWGRTVQSEVTDAHPPFDLVDLDSPDPSHRLRYPLWMKPVKSASSELAFRIDDDQGFQEAVASLREGVDRVGRPFEQIPRRLAPPPAIIQAGPRHCLAEEALRGVQAAVEGYAHRGRAVVYAVLDSVDYPGSPSSLGHQYPSGPPEAVQNRIRDIAVRLIEHHGLDNSTFSVEFFYDPVEDDVENPEINPPALPDPRRAFRTGRRVRQPRAHAQARPRREPARPRRRRRRVLGRGGVELPQVRGRGPHPRQTKAQREQGRGDGHRPALRRVARVQRHTRDLRAAQPDPPGQGDERRSALVPGESYDVELAMNRVEQIFPRGHRIRLPLFTSHWPLAWPPPRPADGAARGQQPGPAGPPGTRGRAPGTRPFGEPEATPEIATARKVPGDHSWSAHRCVAGDHSSLEIVKDGGILHFEDMDLDVGRSAYESYGVTGDDFTSDRGRTSWTMRLTRGEWATRTETHTSLTCNETGFRAYATLDACKGQERVCSRQWTESIPRDHM
ncbi:ATP-grasp domain-containing protein [Nocardiopsis metallicus]|uniref:Xaa-Pro dipeptidyl-peptidase C-terminal domain-containing protein n=1 Tax=Nocardiopsis metallicus TaxID=179819 RepID=A0A840W094_9ACTN|nr:CocE/NonD family hydrolase C-terminal non-catalytic domain-containing protein [Nocardiopsis metallicus]MBB5489482.1 hypothetical protein [Nocardiopsis metallicus]